MDINTSNTLPQNVQTTQYISPKEEPKELFSLQDIKFKLQEIIENMVSTQEPTIEEQLNEKFLDLDFGAEFFIDATKIGLNDAVFFVNLLNQQNLINYTADGNDISLTDCNNKTINATRALINVLETSYTTNKPVRLDFDNDITVVIKLDKDGKVQAHFIPGTLEAESYLKNNIPCLKQRFDDEEINYSYLGYQGKNPKKQQKEQKNER